MTATTKAQVLLEQLRKNLEEDEALKEELIGKIKVRMECMFKLEESSVEEL